LLDRISHAVFHGRHHDDVLVGVVDVGSNTVRLVVAEGDRLLVSRKAMLHLGADVERYGHITPAKLTEVSDVVGGFAAEARQAGVELLEVLVTSPGRQAENGDELVNVLANASNAPVAVLSAIEEGRLAFVGAISSAAPPSARAVAVVDVGGGSAQIVAGTRRDGPTWIRSIDLGSQRLTSRLLDSDPPGRAAVELARTEAACYLEGLDAPPVRATFAVGGSARALKRIVGGRLDAAHLEHVLELLSETPAEVVSVRYGIGAERAATLTAGCVILAGIQRQLGTPIKVVRGGLREGALAELAATRAAA
jgi:exopolyphosphatase/pppGpp-phosphohydrolase